MHDLEVRTSSAADIQRAAPLARGALFELPSSDPHFAEWGPGVIGACLDHGVATAFVFVPATEAELPYIREDETERFYHAVKAFPRRDGDRTPALYHDWRRIVRWLRELVVSAGANWESTLDGDVPSDVKATLLIRRAFRDFSSLRLVSLAPGKSGAGVWYVQPSGADREKRPLPFIVKIDRRERILVERSNAIIIRDVVSPQFHAALDSARCVEGESIALVTYENVAHGRPLIAALPNDPQGLIVGLLERTIGAARSAGVRDKVDLTNEFGYGRLKVLRWPAELDAASERARATSSDIPTPAVLRERLELLPPVSTLVGTVHGDLHSGNLFAARTEVVMIDYGSVKSRAPLVADPACLEVSLTFPSAAAPGAESALTDAWLRKAYTCPLPQPLASVPERGLEWIREAVCEIRLRAMRNAEDRLAYTFAVAANLLRFASYLDNGSEAQRALAYTLACHLFNHVEREVVA